MRKMGLKFLPWAFLKCLIMSAYVHLFHTELVKPNVCDLGVKKSHGNLDVHMYFYKSAKGRENAHTQR